MTAVGVGHWHVAVASGTLKCPPPWVFVIEVVDAKTTVLVGKLRAN